MKLEFRTLFSYYTMSGNYKESIYKPNCPHQVSTYLVVKSWWGYRKVLTHDKKYVTDLVIRDLGLFEMGYLGVRNGIIFNRMTGRLYNMVGLIEFVRSMAIKGGGWLRIGLDD